ncbi:MAG: hypothetical protein ABIP95_02390 [Pelobium sp.]
MTYRIKVLLSALASVFLFIIIYFVLPKGDRIIINFITIIGVILSLLGILIAYFQILSVKNVAIETQNRIKENIIQNNKILTLSDLSRKAAMIDEILGYLRNDKIDLCILRMKDLKILINNLKNQEQYYSLVSKKQFREIFENFNIDLYNFQTCHLENKKKMDMAVVIKNFENLSTLFLDLEIKLKTPEL